MTERTDKLYRSQVDRMIAGVCGGFAEYFDVDSTLVRVIWLIFTVIGGIGFIAYVACLFVMKENPAQDGIKEKKPQNTSLIVGIGLIIFGFALLSSNFGWGLFYFRPFHWHLLRPWFFNWDKFWPVIIIIIGVLYIYHVMSKDKKSSENNEGEFPAKKLTRSKTEKMLGGVCGGISEYLNIDPVLTRVLYIIFTLFSGVFLGVIVYIILLIILPEEDITGRQVKSPSGLKDPSQPKSSKNNKVEGEENG